MFELHLVGNFALTVSPLMGVRVIAPRTHFSLFVLSFFLHLPLSSHPSAAPFTKEQ